MPTEIRHGRDVEGPCAQRDVLAGRPELREVEVDRVDQGYRHRIVDDGVPTAGLPGSGVQRQQGGLGNTAQGDALF